MTDLLRSPPLLTWSLIGWLLGAVSANAESYPSMPQEGVPLQMRTLENPPLEFTAPSGEITGIVVDIIREAVRRTGHEVEFDIYPWKRVIHETAIGNVDAAFNAGKSAERVEWGHYHATPLIDETYVFFSRGPKSLSATLEEAPTLRVGTQLGYFYGEHFQQLMQDPPFLAMEVVPTIEHSLRLLMGERTDVFLGDLLPTLYYLRKLGLEDKIHIVREKGTDTPLVVSTSPTYVAFSRKTVDEAYVKAFNDALESMKADSTYSTILNSYGLNTPELP